MITPKVITAPTIEPVVLSEVKEHLRIDHSEEDTKLDIFITAARQHFEQRTGRTLHQTTLEIAMNRFPGSSDAIRLPRAAPLQSVTSVKYVDSGGTENTWASSGYIVDTYEDVGQVVLAYGASWPSYTPYPLNSVRIRYVAGILNASPQTYPEEGIRQCIFLLVGGMYESRESMMPTADRLQLSAFAENPALKTMIDQWIVERVY